MMKRGTIARSLLVAVIGQLTLVGCVSTSGDPVPSQTSAEAKTFTVRGIVKGVKNDGTMISVHHETIPGYMMSMTMPFFVKDPQEAIALKEGDGIEFEYHVDGNESHIVNIRHVDPAEVGVSE